MSKRWQGGTVAALVFLFAVAMWILPNTRQPAFGGGAEEQKSAGGAHYSVVMTEGHNLLVTDNATNKLYFYTTDKDTPVGSPLKLRASLDLTKVGQPEIRITAHNLEKFQK
jgi:hypothetical protein